VSSNSYGKILKATTFLSGASILNLILGVARGKAGAIFLGPEGVGLLNILYNLLHLLRTAFEFGMGGSAIRHIASEKGKGNSRRVGEYFFVLLCLYLGLGCVGCLLCFFSSDWISKATFGTALHSSDIKKLAFNIPLVLLAPIFGGMLAVYGEMTKLAKSTFFSTFFGVLLSVILFALLGFNGIIPGILATSFSALVASWWFGRQVRVRFQPVQFCRFIEMVRILIPLGLALLWNDLLTWIIILFKSSFIVKTLGLGANGIYSAAWALSGMFVNMILNALGTEFYPRLCSVADNSSEVRRCINEQTEVSLLLAMPGLLFTILFSKVIVFIAYSPEFLPASDILLWLTLANFFRIITWPIPYALLAKNLGFVFAAFNTANQIIGLALFAVAIPFGGIYLAAIAAAIAGFLTNFILYFIAWRYCHFFPDSKSIWAMSLAGFACLFSLLSVQFLPVIPGHVVAFFLFVFASLLCFRLILQRVHAHPRFIKFFEQSSLGCWALKNGRSLFRIK